MITEKGSRLFTLFPSRQALWQKPQTGMHLIGAAQMRRDGVLMETICKETGWFTSKDQKWRFKIDDNKVTFKVIVHRDFNDPKKS